MRLIDDINNWRQRFPDAVALISSDEQTLTWNELHHEISRVATALARHGCSPSDRIAILAPNSIDYLVGFLGSLAAGACVVPLPTGIAGQSIRMMLDECNPAAIFVHPSYRTVVDEWVDTFAGRRALIITVEDCDSSALTLEQLKQTGTDAVPSVDIRPDMWFNIIYSSGTTGQPKGIVHTHACREAHVAAIRSLATKSTAALNHDSLLFLSTALYSNATIAPFIAGLAVGATILLMKKFDTLQFLELCESRHPTHVVLVPTQVQRILDHPQFDDLDLGSRTVKLTSTAKLPAARKLELVDRWPGGVIDGYGQTEGGPVTCWMSESDMHKPDSVGRAVAASEIKIIDENGRALPAGERGEVVGRSETMMWGYFNHPDATVAQKWIDDDGREFLRTGDIGKLDDDGYLYIIDRSKDVIISGGFNIYASDIEDVLLSHPAVGEAAVIAVPSKQWGETPLALVVPRAGNSVLADDLLQWANERLGKIQRLSRVEVRTELPRSDIGKVLKRGLRMQYCDFE